MSHSSWVPRSFTSSGAARCRAALLLAALALLTASGCENPSTGGGEPNGSGGQPNGSGGQPNTGGTSTGPVEEANYASALAEANCTGISGCCRSGGFAFDEASCVDRVRAQYSALVDSRSREPNLRFDEAAAARCVAAIRAANAACTDKALAEATYGACNGVFAGTLALGAACTSSIECAAGPGEHVACDQGKCARWDSEPRLPRGVEGVACAASCQGDPSRDYCPVWGEEVTGALCWSGDELYCSPETERCVALAAVGDACGAGADDDPCVDRARCQDGVCIAAVIGDPCGSAGRDCPAASRCDAESRTCRARKANGHACFQGDDCVSLECRSGICTDFTRASNDSCSGLMFY